MIDDTTLDALLSEARLEIAHDKECEVCAHAIGRRPEERRRWPRRVAIAGAAGVAVLSIGAGAAATVGLPFLDPSAPVQHTQTVSNGDSCHASYRVVPDAMFPAAASLAAARLALAQLDIGALDISDEIKEVTESYADSEWMGTGPEPDFFYPTDSLDSVEAAALNDAIFDAIGAEVRAQGLPDRGYSMEGEFTCDDYERAITGE